MAVERDLNGNGVDLKCGLCGLWTDDTSVCLTVDYGEGLGGLFRRHTVCRPCVDVLADARCNDELSGLHCILPPHGPEVVHHAPTVPSDPESNTLEWDDEGKVVAPGTERQGKVRG